jgi:trimethylamine--corrinoid protein Co-methyltransferase
VVDAQSGHEKTLTGLTAALAGANLIYGLGMIESGVTFDFAQLVMDDEFARMIKHVVRGIPVRDETLAVDVIDEVGPFNDFMAHDHTMAHMREQSQPALIDRRVREDWTAMGGTTIYERAAARARKLIESHVPLPLPEGAAATMRAIVEGAERELGVRGVRPLGTGTSEGGRA